MKKAIFCWSGGKDSALALYRILNAGSYQVEGLLTTHNKSYHRSSMHGVRSSLLKRQAKSIGLREVRVNVRAGCSNADYEREMKKVLLKCKKEGVTHVIFGDIYLDWIRAYRRKNLNKIGLKCVFPIWGESTKRLSKEFIRLGFRTVLTCIDKTILSKAFLGRTYALKLLKDLPSQVDPCGENGEFHTFTFDGPIFANKIKFRKGRSVLKHNRFYFQDLLPAM